MRSSIARRCRCAATTSGAYSTKLPGSQRSATFSRAVRWAVFRRRAGDRAALALPVLEDGERVDGIDLRSRAAWHRTAPLRPTAGPVAAFLSLAALTVVYLVA